VHHTNEIAQSESATGKKPWVKYWLHNEFLVLGAGEKMAKSGDNFITLSVLEQKGFHPLDYRFFCLGTHYRKPLMFSWEAMEGAKNSRRKLLDKVLELKKNFKSEKSNKKLKTELLQRFTAEISDDLNSAQALATMWEVIYEAELTAEDRYDLLLRFDEVLGLNLSAVKESKIPEAVIELAEEREKARRAKDWKKSDELRGKIKQMGYVVGDSAEGYKITKI